jgi:hypothetical protein
MTKVKTTSACAVAMFSACLCAGQPYFVSPAGDDANPGTLEKPFATLQQAQQAARQKHGGVFLRGGAYYLPATLVFTAQDSGTKDAPVVFQNYQGEKAVISGGIRLENLDWQPYTNGIFQAKVPANLQTGEIFVNGERQVLARYPNFDPKAQYFDGFSADAISGPRAARWSDPAGGYYHAGRFHLAHHRQGHQRPGAARRRVAEQSRLGGALANPLRGEYLRGIGRSRRMVFEFQNTHAVFLSARRTRFEKRRRGSDAPANAG